MSDVQSSRIWKKEETKNTAYFIYKYLQVASEKNQINLKKT